MCETPEESVGVALCMVENTPSGTPIYGLITYKWVLCVVLLTDFSFQSVAVLLEQVPSVLNS